jgi:hypothetical protein
MRQASTSVSDRSASPTHREGVALADGDLFAWSGGGVVLLGERVDDRWILARGWLAGDCLAHIRRWSFAEPRAFAGQARRLAEEASGDPALARSVGARAGAWSEAVSPDHGPATA